MSDRPVLERLQVKAGRRLAMLGVPDALDARIGGPRAPVEAAGVVVLFQPSRAALEAQLAPLLAQLAPGAILWLAYPKLTSPLAADLSRNLIHDLAPSFGLDAVAQIALDDDWSAMRFKRIG